VIDENMVRNALGEAKRGMQRWNAFVREKAPAASDCVVVFPEKDEAINEEGMRCLREYVDGISARRVWIFYVRAELGAEFCDYCPAEYCATRLSEDEMRAILRFFGLKEISNRVVIVSLNRPEGRAGDKAINRNGFPLSDVVRYGIYALKAGEARC
jgi:hypothetical protein